MSIIKMMMMKRVGKKKEEADESIVEPCTFGEERTFGRDIEDQIRFAVKTSRTDWLSEHGDQFESSVRAPNTARPEQLVA
jgi:hypothetical protein